MEMQCYGPIVNVGSDLAPYQNSRRLITDADVKGDAERAHSCVISGSSAIRDTSGNYLHEKVWRYLFTHPVEQARQPVPADRSVWIDQRSKRPD